MSGLNSALIIAMLPKNAKTVFVAYSGGMDSHVLLHLCASEPSLRGRVTAVYVHHGLQAEAGAWADHCHEAAKQLAVAFRQLNVDGRAKPRQSPEEAARNARYGALRALLDKDDVLLTAQHREDQLETVLLQLFRGAGVAGLAAMPVDMPFGRGRLIRPLLHAGKERIVGYAQQYGLKWVEDPSNQAVDFDRNYLRHQVIPLLKRRWPGVDKTVARSARHCSEAAGLLNELADEWLQTACDRHDMALNIDAVSALDRSRQSLLLRRWFDRQGLKMPGEALLHTIMAEIVGARADSDPELRIQGFLIKRYRGHLYCVPSRVLLKEGEQVWPEGEDAVLRRNGYRLRRVPSPSGIPARLWTTEQVTIRVRTGGEAIKLSGRKGHHALKKLFQEAGVPPWLRSVVPLIYLNDRLAAVGGYWIAEDFYSSGGENCYRICWETDK